ncbi:MAG: hypothetical protein V3V99_09640 [candidate division Zixibacteria bacterium]
MPKRKKAIKYAKLGEKDLWHPYGLQSLNSERFIVVVNRILKGKIGLLPGRQMGPLQGTSLEL